MYFDYYQKTFYVPHKLSRVHLAQLYFILHITDAFIVGNYPYLFYEQHYAVFFFLFEYFIYK